VSDAFYEDDEHVTDVITAFERGVAARRERARQVDSLADVVSQPVHVLLTGAAGFVGSHLLARLLGDPLPGVIPAPRAARSHHRRGA
jgi:hypothetical protein